MEIYREDGRLNSLRLYADKTTVGVITELGLRRTRQIAMDLRSIDGRIGPGQPLPTPKPGRKPPFGGCPDRRDE